MKKLTLICLSALFAGVSLFAQNVAINTTGAVANTSAMLDVDANNKGLLVPRVALTSTTDVATVPTPANSLLVYNTATASAGTTAVTPGYYYWDNAATVWRRFMQANEGWLTGGNLGTVAGTNFAGTADNTSFDIRTNNTIRARILNTGLFSVNNLTPVAGDVFSVYGTGYAGAITAAGNFAINGYAGANGIGVAGESNSAAANTGIGVLGSLFGTATATGTSSFGVYGENFTLPTGTGVAYGVFGISAGATGNTFGVAGQSGSPTGVGVVGINTSVTGAANGVVGQTASVAGTGVFGVSTAASLTTNTSVGVFGRTLGTVSTGNAIGVRGFADALTGANVYAFYGQSLSSAGTGGIAFVTSSGAGWQGQNAGTGDALRGFNTNATPATAGAGVFGQTNATTSAGGEFLNTNASGTGVMAGGNNVTMNYLVAGSGGAFTGTGIGSYSQATTAASGIGVMGVGNNLATVLTPANGAGVVGSGTQYGIMGFATTTVNTNPLNNSAFAGVNASAGGYFEVQNGGTAQTWSYVAVRDNGGVLRKIIGTGTVNTIVKDLNDQYVALSCPETPENLFQDYGHGQLINGFAHIDIDPILAKNIIVNEKHPLRVFVQLEGDCQGVFVLNKTGNGFDVKELNGGSSNVEFSYTIVANRADELLPDGSISKYSEERFPTAPGPQEKTVQQTSTYNKKTSPVAEELPVDNNLPQIPANTIIKKKKDQ